MTRTQLSGIGTVSEGRKIILKLVRYSIQPGPTFRYAIGTMFFETAKRTLSQGDVLTLKLEDKTPLQVEVIRTEARAKSQKCHIAIRDQDIPWPSIQVDTLGK